MMTCAHASGPLILEGPTGNTPVRYQNPNIVLNFDIDVLAATLNDTNAESDELVQNAFDLWNAVTTDPDLGLSTIRLTQGVDINISGTSVDVDDTNYATFIPAGSGAPIPTDDGQNPVIYDADGAIIDIFFGIGQSDNIGGFAASSFFIGGSAYIEGFAVINGRDLPRLDQLQMTLIVAHEIGHFMGLDHTLVDIEEDLFATACTTKAPIQYPLMYPVICRNDQSLHQDDIISVSTLYPSADISQQFGQITGKFLQVNNSAILGANIWVQNTITMEVYSVVSDYLTSGTGFFSLYLPPGDYTLHANSIDPTFNGGSGVGPYSQDSSDISFQAPLAPAAISVNYGGDMVGSTKILTVTTGEATNVTFKLDGSGSDTGGNNIFIPPTTTKESKKGGGGGGATTPVLLMLLAATMYLRIFRHRQKT